MTSGDRRAPTIVANPGGLRWMEVMASAVGRAGLLRAYMTPLALTPALERRLPRRLSSELGRRAVPDGVDPGLVCRVAMGTELVRLAAARLPLPDSVGKALSSRRSRAFDVGVSRRLHEGDGTVIATVGGARDTLRRARTLRIRSLLDYPVAHYRFVDAILREEARLKPEFAPALRLEAPFGGVWREVEEELATADKILVQSSFQRRTFMEAGVPESKLELIPFGVDLDLFRPMPRPTDDVFRVLFVGQITPRKGISYLLDGFSRAGIPDSELVLVGRPVGTTRPWSGRPGVRHVPHQARWRLPAYYAACDAFVLPSLAEGFPQVALEAMACGRPVIVSENAFGEDVITSGRDGHIVPIRDADAIADRLRHLHDHAAERAELGVSARRRAEDFPWERYGERIVELVEEGFR